MSTIKTINFTAPASFSFDPAKVMVDAGGASLIRRALTPNEIGVATGRVQQVSDLGLSIAGMFPRGSASWSKANQYDCTSTDVQSYISMNDDSARDGITPLPNNESFDFGAVGTIRFKYTPTYTGAPSGVRYFFSTGASTIGSAKGLGSLLAFYHDSNAGRLTLISRNGTDTGTTTQQLGNWLPVAGTTYEFEMNIDSNAGTVSLYIDGILKSSGSVRVGVTSRDYFYWGNYYSQAVGVSSEAYFSDIQIFNTLQHTQPFSSEIPRIVNLYPAEAIVEPLESAVAEGLIDFGATVSVVVNDENVRYVLKVENNLHYFNGTAVAPSNGTYAQANELADMVTNVQFFSDFVASGARVYLVPILYSGAYQNNSVSIQSTVLNYDFFAVAAPCQVCTLYGFIKDNCEDVVEGTVQVISDGPILTQSRLLTLNETITIDPLEKGFFEIPLVIPNHRTVQGTLVPDTERNDKYTAIIKWTDTKGRQQGYVSRILIPNQSAILLVDAIELAKDS